VTSGRRAAATRRDLRELARLCGVQTSYRSIEGTRVSSRSEALIGVLRSMGKEIDGPNDAPEAVAAQRLDLARRVIEPVTVAWDGRLESVHVQLPSGATDAPIRIGIAGTDEDEPRAWTRVRPVPSSNPGTLPGFVCARLSTDRLLTAGYHRLFVESAAGLVSSLVMAAPRRLPAPVGHPWGVFVPLHGVRSARGVGGYGDLERLYGWLHDHGGRVLATLPLLAGFLEDPCEPSPYSPASRLFWNELYLDVDGVPGLDACPEAREALRDPALWRGLDRGPFVDLEATMAAKRRVLEPLAHTCFSGDPPPRYRAFLTERPELRDYARFRSEMDRRRSWWSAWPEAERDGELTGDPEDDSSGRYHLFVQWLAHEQLERWTDRSATGEGLYLDLPLGASAGSYDVWRHRGSFATGASAGAPADTFFPHGQAWGFPPLHPERIREDGYRYPIACLRNLLRYASVVRIDHVMSLHRLYWIPAQFPAELGVYVRYRPEEWYAAISIEANRTGAVVVGEDLGTVPREVRVAMRRHGMLGSYVVQLEARPDPAGALPDPPAGSLASVNTHDLPMWAGFWEGDDVVLSRDLGIIGENQAAERHSERRALREAIAAFLSSRDLLGGGDADPGRVLDACVRFLAGGDASVVVATLEDLWLERRPQNVPGTGAERPNWRGRLAFTLDELAADPRVTDALSRIDRVRRADRNTTERTARNAR
jgi:4-alpha-glucanotransferase